MQLKAQLPRPTATAVLGANNTKVNLINTGELWDYKNSSGGKYYFPNNASIPDSLKTSIIYSGGLWMSARETSGDLHLAAQRYFDSTEYYAGPIDASGIVNTTKCNLWNRMFLCTRAEVNTFRTYVSNFGTPVPLTSIPSDILNWPGKGNPTLTGLGMTLDHEIAPFVDANADGIYNPIDGDFPCIKGDECVFYVINDKGPHAISGGDYLGVEIHVMNYAYHYSNIINNTAFYDISVINRSSINYSDYYLGMFVDNDFGCYNNDYIGCQPSKNMAVLYNGITYDATCSTLGFLDHLPIAGIKILNSPLNSSSIQTGLTSFTYLINSAGPQGDPHTINQYNNYLTGKWSDGTDYTLDGNGYGGATPTKYIYSGNPADSTQWSECHNQVSGRNLPSDRRFLMSSGPYNLPVSTKLEFTYAVFATYLDSTQFSNPNFDSTINPAADSVQAFYDAIHLFCNDGVLGIENPIELNSKAIVFPNPLTGNILNVNLDNDVAQGNYDIEIFNINGQVVYSNNMEINNSKLTIDLNNENLSKGFYTIRLQKNNLQIQAKFIVSE